MRLYLLSTQEKRKESKDVEIRCCEQTHIPWLGGGTECP